MLQKISVLKISQISELVAAIYIAPAVGLARLWLGRCHFSPLPSASVDSSFSSLLSLLSADLCDKSSSAGQRQNKFEKAHSWPHALVLNARWHGQLTRKKDPEKTRFLGEGLKTTKIETDENREKLIADLENLFIFRHFKVHVRRNPLP